jgi:hypothetical protein
VSDDQLKVGLWVIAALIALIVVGIVIAVIASAGGETPEPPAQEELDYE